MIFYLTEFKLLHTRTKPQMLTFLPTSELKIVWYSDKVPEITSFKNWSNRTVIQHESWETMKKEKHVCAIHRQVHKYLAFVYWPSYCYPGHLLQYTGVKIKLLIWAQNTNSQLWVNLHPNRVNSAGITALVCPKTYTSPKSIGQLIAQLFHAQVSVIS